MRYTVGLAQTDSVLGDVEANVERHRHWIDQAKAGDVDLLVFPELSLTGYLLQDLVPEVALRADDEVFARLNDPSLALCAGGIEETDAHAQYIAGFYVDEGRVEHVHRKVYLASYGVFDEARYVGAGRRVRAFDTRFGRMGMCICEDAWHPSLVGLLLLDGANLVVVQTASPVRDLSEGEMPRNAVTWMDTLRTYSRLYGTYIAFCNRVGTEDGLVFWGNSVLFGPEGETVAQGPLYEEALVLGEVDTERVRQARLTNPVLREEKLDLTARELHRIAGGFQEEPQE